MATKRTKKTEAPKEETKNIKEHVYHSGENLRAITKELTGNTYLMFRLLEKNGLTLNDLVDGIILKWE